MNAWYNEIDPYAAQWLENLAAAGHVAAGAVERRSVRELQAVDVPDGRQCHFFAGIGGWSAALRLAGWPDDLPVWTGSCPCQPFSAAGKGRGFDDERHLWPAWFELIRERQPSIVFGEQVASPAGLAWFDTVQADLEASGYAVGAADLCVASVGAPHIRQRLFFVAVADHAIGRRLERVTAQRLVSQGQDGARPVDRERMGNAGGARSGRDTGADARAEEKGNREGVDARRVGDKSELASAARGFWYPAEWVACRDGKSRPVEPGTFPLAHGVPNRVGKLRGYGNAINPHVAATFIEAAREWIG